jgi:hypothetical protein
MRSLRFIIKYESPLKFLRDHPTVRLNFFFFSFHHNHNSYLLIFINNSLLHSFNTYLNFLNKLQIINSVAVIINSDWLHNLSLSILNV